MANDSQHLFCIKITKTQLADARFSAFRNCWMLPLALALVFPSNLHGRATVACATFAAEIAVAMAESSLQLANATGGDVMRGLENLTLPSWFTEHSKEETS